MLSAIEYGETAERQSGQEYLSVCNNIRCMLMKEDNDICGQGDDTRELMDVAFGGNKYDKSFVYLLKKIRTSATGKTQWKECFLFSRLDQAGSISLKTNPRESIYITASSFKSPGKSKYGMRSVRNIASFHNIVIDIDINMLHDATPSDVHDILGSPLFMELFQESAYTLLDDVFFNSLTIPRPNIVHFTGRGIQLWYCLEQLPSSARPIYQTLQDSFADALKEADEETVAGIEDKLGRPVFTIDYGAMNSSGTGVFRMFNTYNCDTQTRTYAFIARREKYGAEELLRYLQCGTDPVLPETAYCPKCGSRLVLRKGKKQAFWGCGSYEETGCDYTQSRLNKRPDHEFIHYTAKQKKEYKKKKASVRARSEARNQSLDGLAGKRVNFLLWLIDHREKEGTLNGLRDKMLFHLYNALVTTAAPEQRNDMWQYVQALNNGFSHPLKESQMRTIREAVDKATTSDDHKSHETDRCGHYSYSDKKFVEHLCLADEEKLKYKAICGGKAEVREKRNQEKQKKQEDYLKKVVNGLASGASNAEIAKSIGKSTRTVFRTKKAAGLKKARDAEIIAYRKQGRTIDEIVDMLKGTARQASRATVVRVIRRYKDQQEQQEQLIKETSM